MTCASGLKPSFQELLEQHHRLEGELFQIEARIEQKEVEYLSGQCNQGNFLVGWHKAELSQIPRKNMDISAKDKRFSLSSVFSRPSLELSTEDRRLSVGGKGHFHKK